MFIVKFSEQSPSHLRQIIHFLCDLAVSKKWREQILNLENGQFVFHYIHPWEATQSRFGLSPAKVLVQILADDIHLWDECFSFINFKVPVFQEEIPLSYVDLHSCESRVQIEPTIIDSNREDKSPITDQPLISEPITITKCLTNVKIKSINEASNIRDAVREVMSNNPQFFPEVITLYTVNGLDKFLETIVGQQVCSGIISPNSRVITSLRETDENEEKIIQKGDSYYRDRDYEDPLKNSDTLNRNIEIDPQSGSSISYSQNTNTLDLLDPLIKRLIQEVDDIHNIINKLCDPIGLNRNINLTEFPDFLCIQKRVSEKSFRILFLPGHDDMLVANKSIARLISVICGIPRFSLIDAGTTCGHSFTGDPSLVYNTPFHVVYVIGSAIEDFQLTVSESINEWLMEIVNKGTLPFVFPSTFDKSWDSREDIRKRNGSGVNICSSAAYIIRQLSIGCSGIEAVMDVLDLFESIGSVLSLARSTMLPFSSYKDKFPCSKSSSYDRCDYTPIKDGRWIYYDTLLKTFNCKFIPFLNSLMGSIIEVRVPWKYKSGKRVLPLSKGVDTLRLFHLSNFFGLVDRNSRELTPHLLEEFDHVIFIGNQNPNQIADHKNEKSIDSQFPLGIQLGNSSFIVDRLTPSLIVNEGVYNLKNRDEPYTVHSLRDFEFLIMGDIAFRGVRCAPRGDHWRRFDLKKHFILNTHTVSYVLNKYELSESSKLRNTYIERGDLRLDFEMSGNLVTDNTYTDNYPYLESDHKFSFDLEKTIKYKKLTPSLILDDPFLYSLLCGFIGTEMLEKVLSKSKTTKKGIISMNKVLPPQPSDHTIDILFCHIRENCFRGNRIREVKEIINGKVRVFIQGLCITNLSGVPDINTPCISCPNKGETTIQSYTPLDLIDTISDSEKKDTLNKIDESLESIKEEVYEHIIFILYKWIGSVKNELLGISEYSVNQRLLNYSPPCTDVEIDTNSDVEIQSLHSDLQEASQTSPYKEYVRTSITCLSPSGNEYTNIGSMKYGTRPRNSMCRASPYTIVKTLEKITETLSNSISQLLEKWSDCLISGFNGVFMEWKISLIHLCIQRGVPLFERSTILNIVTKNQEMWPDFKQWMSQFHSVASIGNSFVAKFITEKEINFRHFHRKCSFASATSEQSTGYEICDNDILESCSLFWYRITHEEDIEFRLDFINHTLNEFLMWCSNQIRKKIEDLNLTILDGYNNATRTHKVLGVNYGSGIGYMSYYTKAKDRISSLIIRMGYANLIDKFHLERKKGLREDQLLMERILSIKKIADYVV